MTQRSALGLLLILIYINDPSKFISDEKNLLFADETNFISINEDGNSVLLNMENSQANDSDSVLLPMKYLNDDLANGLPHKFLGGV